MHESGWYAPGTEFRKDAPWNQVDTPEKDFELTVSQTLSKTVDVCTNDYCPEYEEETGHTYANTENTIWSKVYAEDHYTPLQLIQMFKETLESQLKSWEGMEETPSGKREVRKIEHLIEECSYWNEDETEFVED